MADAGDGTLSLTVGVYRAPSDPALTDKHILGFSVNYGVGDEQLINQLDVSFTDPAQAYASSQTDPVKDSASIALTGVIRSQPLDLSWVQYKPQATRLGQRALLRLNPQNSGTLVTTLYGMRYLGKRWVKVQYPFIAGLEDCVVEIQSSEVDLLAGTVSFTWNLVDTAAIAAL
jgi:hypothetical protein